MAGETAGDILAGILGIEREEAQRRLDRFSGGMTAELLDRGRLSVDGLGLFSLIHEQPVREKTSSGTLYLPPRNGVIFEHRPERAGDSAAIASGRLDMEASEARRFAKALSAMFKQLGKGSGSVELRGFGSFTVTSGRFQFLADPSLEELLNSLYGGLKSIVVQEHQQPTLSPPIPGKPLSLKKVLLVVAAVSLLAGGGFLFQQIPRFDFDSPKREAASMPGDQAPRDQASSAQLVPTSVSAPADSVLLLKGRFTVVAATFSTRKVARQEMRRLSGIGHRIRIWPVRQDGIRYYRLVLGDFATWRTARDSMKVIPAGLPGNSYIQQAHKNVVLYGEQGL
ncbi:MAG: SPOR domain-containing protein [Chlorobiaceae bacterium]|nr:SPOR domain-containing protein [Chlorobiaceae bacterium]